MQKFHAALAECLGFLLVAPGRRILARTDLHLADLLIMRVAFGAGEPMGTKISISKLRHDAAKHQGQVVDQSRRGESKGLQAEHDDGLKRTPLLWALNKPPRCQSGERSWSRGSYYDNSLDAAILAVKFAAA